MLDADLTSNIGDVEDWVDDLVATFGFVVAGVRGQSLGDDIVAAVAESISEDCRNGVAPDGSTWEDNREPYKTWKADKYGSYDPGYKTGETLSIKALVGEVEIKNETITQSHGTGEVDDDGASDIEKGEYLTEGHNSSPRPFYEFNSQRVDKVVEVADEGLGRYLGSK